MPGMGQRILSKAAFIQTGDENLRKLLRGVPAFGRALKSDIPFPKNPPHCVRGRAAGVLAGLGETGTSKLKPLYAVAAW